MTRYVLAGVAALLCAGAGATETPQRAGTADAMRDGCHVQQVHTPAGKLVHAAPIVQCSEEREPAVADDAAAAQASRPSAAE